LSRSSRSAILFMVIVVSSAVVVQAGNPTLPEIHDDRFACGAPSPDSLAVARRPALSGSYIRLGRPTPQGQDDDPRRDPRALWHRRAEQIGGSVLASYVLGRCHHFWFQVCVCLHRFRSLTPERDRLLMLSTKSRAGADDWIRGPTQFESSIVTGDERRSDCVSSPNGPVDLYRRFSHPVMDRLMGESVSALTGIWPGKDG
jgi:hypothetical protein